MVTRNAIFAAALSLAAMAPLACSAAAPAGAGRQPATAAPVPANPVPVLKLTGATPDPGESQGHLGVVGDRVASGTFPSGEQVFVDTYATQAALNAAMAGHVPQDGETSLRGPGLSLLDVDCIPGGCIPSAAVIATRIGGKVTGP